MTGTVLSIERSSLHDGPGIRTTVFLKGCPLSCAWCHNPESQSFEPEIFFIEEKCIKCGRCDKPCPAREIKGIKMTAVDIMDIVYKDIDYYKNSGGGLTISGGEPLAQLELTKELLQMAKKRNIHTCIETSGYVKEQDIISLIPLVDIFLYDYKIGKDKHLKYIGCSLDIIINNLKSIDKLGAKIILRCPIIPTINDTDEHFLSIAEYANSLKNIIEINIMPYHPMGVLKSKRLGRAYPLANLGFTDTKISSEWVKILQQKTNTPVI